jgi:hypothetical protein
MGLTESLAAGLDLVLGTGLLDVRQHVSVLGALNGHLQSLEVVGWFNIS